MALKNRIKIGNAVDKDLFEQLSELSDATRIPRSKLLDEALELLLKQDKYKEYVKLGSQ